ncbi:MAG: F0F1 ATP synthase subunit B [Chloroflexi bacterium]|nr:F0F1 ATP synthase subunit B [Chloroflexota bacterium]MBU1748316.1 F0F1 ATP synthase subunit B [Chloroflexota bacterium]MBU1878513.1 F0F1 ATP synthase subunit B [Chloroflexota bacterium]
METLQNLGINIPLLISQCVNFGLLFALLTAFLYRPVQRMLAERQTRIAEGLEKAKVAEQRAAEAEQAYQERIEQARREGQAIVAQATETGEKSRQEILVQAKEEATLVKQRGREELGLERKRVQAELRDETVRLAADMARKVLAETLGEADQHQLVDRVIGRIGEGQL